MGIISVEVSEDVANRFAGQKVVKMDDILDYQDNLKYTFSDEKVTLRELSDFLGETIKSKKSSVC